MYRVTKMSGKFYAIKINSIEDDQENIDSFVNDQIPVIIVSELSELEKLEAYDSKLIAEEMKKLR